MEQKQTTDTTFPEIMRETGMSLFFSGLKENDNEKKNTGIRYLLTAYHEKDVEAQYWVGILMYDGFLRPKSGDPKEAALRNLYEAANRGSLKARTRLNRLCLERYEAQEGMQPEKRPVSGPLVDFEGNRIRIDRTGWRTPIDAVLEYENGINRLVFRLNLLFSDMEVQDPEAFQSAVIKGIREWEGDYQVFGGQQLQIVIDITINEKVYDTVVILPVTDNLAAGIQKASRVFHTKTGEKNVNDLINHKRSMSIMGIRKWSTRSRKFMYLASEDGSFTDLYEIQHVAKHEFGHLLGLGDLYASSQDGLEGVEKGTFAELDGFYVGNKIYNLVMSDHHGPVSNNDIEMVVLAFSEDKVQLYQKDPNMKGFISEALGKGN